MFRDKRPQLVKVHTRLVEVAVVGVHVEVPHTNLNNKCHLRTKVFFRWIEWATFPKYPGWYLSKLILW